MDFYTQVSQLCRQIPTGCVATYGQIARLCGKLGGARQVGYAMANRLEEGVPAHRVVNSKGELSGAHAFLVPGLQRSLLEAEGVSFDAAGRVDLKVYGWRPSPEELKGFITE